MTDTPEEIAEMRARITKLVKSSSYQTNVDAMIRTHKGKSPIRRVLLRYIMGRHEQYYVSFDRCREMGILHLLQPLRKMYKAGTVGNKLPKLRKLKKYDRRTRIISNSQVS